MVASRVSSQAVGSSGDEDRAHGMSAVLQRDTLDARTAAERRIAAAAAGYVPTVTGR